MIKSFKTVKHKSHNPYNKQGLYLMNLMKSNAESTKIINPHSFSVHEISEDKIILENNYNETNSTIDNSQNSNCISLN